MLPESRLLGCGSGFAAGGGLVSLTPEKEPEGGRVEVESREFRDVDGVEESSVEGLEFSAGFEFEAGSFVSSFCVGRLGLGFVDGLGEPTLL